MQILQCAVSSSWNAIQPSTRSKERMLSSLVTYGHGQGCNTRHMQFSASGSSLALQECQQFHHHEAQGHKPSQDLPGPTQEFHIVLAIEKKRWETNRAKGIGLRVSGHVDTCLSWVSAALTRKVLACLLLCFNSSDHCLTMCESTNQYYTLKEQASSSVLQCKQQINIEIKSWYTQQNLIIEKTNFGHLGSHHCLLFSTIDMIWIGSDIFTTPAQAVVILPYACTQYGHTHKVWMTPLFIFTN